MAIPTFLCCKVKDLSFGTLFQYNFHFYLRGKYDRSLKRYSCLRLSAANDNLTYYDELYFSGDDNVFPAILNLD